MTTAAFVRNRLAPVSACILLAACGTPAGTVKSGGVVEWADHAPETVPADLSILKGIYEYRSGSLANEMIRIVSIDGRKVPGQFAVAEGADALSLRPGVHEAKLLWVHAEGELDWYTYATVQVDARPNCIYRFHSSLGLEHKAVQFVVTDAPLTGVGNQACGQGLIGESKQRLG
jgi:hypothetical protein